MKHPDQKIHTWLAGECNITIKSFCNPDDIALLSLKDTFVESSNYNPILSKKESLISASLQQDANVTIAYTDERKIIGISILQYPSPVERWVKIENSVMMEVSVVEVATKWRSRGISKKLFELLFEHPLKEYRIIYMVGYSWTWDVAGTGISVIEYRNMLKTYHPDNHKHANLQSIVSALDTINYIKSPKEFLITGFAEYCSRVLEKVGEILGGHPLIKILDDIEKVLGYVKKYQAGSKEKNKIGINALIKFCILFIFQLFIHLLS